jgi:hypothetical protein
MPESVLKKLSGVIEAKVLTEILFRKGHFDTKRQRNWPKPNFKKKEIKISKHFYILSVKSKGVLKRD